MKKLLTICFLCIFNILNVCAAVVDGIAYNINTSNFTATVISNNDSKYSGYIHIPSTIEVPFSNHQKYTFRVTYIGSSAFSYCTDLKSISLPNTIEEIGSSAFMGCAGLTSFEIPNSTKTIRERAFYRCSNLEKLNVPNSVTYIEDFAFADCASLSSVVFSDSVSYVGNGIFSGCFSLPQFDNARYAGNFLVATADRSITTCKIKEGTQYIGEGAFGLCRNLTSISIPETVRIIFNNAFGNCEKLSTIRIPESVVLIKSKAFSGCAMTPLYIMGQPTLWYDTFEGFNGDVVGYKKLDISKTTLSSDRFYAIDDVKWINCIRNSYLKGFEFCIDSKMEEYIGIKEWNFYHGSRKLTCINTHDNFFDITGFENISLEKEIIFSYKSFDGNNYSSSCNVCFQYPEGNIKYQSTQSTITVTEIKWTSDKTCPSPSKTSFVYNNKEYTNLPATIEGFYPGQYVRFDIVAYYDYQKIVTNVPVYTSNISIGIDNKYTATASSLELNGNYIKGDAVITDEKFLVDGKTYEGDSVKATGLDPKKTYSVTYSLKANGHEFTATGNFATKTLTMNTLQPKVISVGNVIVAAESNICDEETNVGFEWRRTDWSDDFSSNTGVAYMYNDQMEGYIRNMNAEKLWKCRPFYLSDSGQYYYGDWVGVDPSNTSYFEATVHTYSSIKVEGNTALVKGYALRGTDAIKVQGFVYWKRVSDAKANTGRKYVMSVPDNALTIESSGQIMSATLKDLDYSSEYCYMAFVTTTEGETFYGEEQTFSTGPEDVTGIDIVYDNGNESLYSTEVVGYYDLNGRRIPEPQRGVNIVRYANGTSRKLFKK